MASIEVTTDKCSSVNRSPATMEMKSINLTCEVYKSYIVQKVLPSIIAKWPDRRS